MIFALLLTLSPALPGVGTARAPVRITYFKAPTLTLPPLAGEVVNAPLIPHLPASLPPRPQTASVAAPSPEGVSVGVEGAAGGAGWGPGVPTSVTQEGEGAETGSGGVAPEQAPVDAQVPRTVSTGEGSGDAGGARAVVPVSPAAPAPEDVGPAPRPARPPKAASGAGPKPAEGAPPERAVSVAPARVEPAEAPPEAPPEAVAQAPRSSGGGEVVVIRKGMPQPTLTKKVVPKYPPMARAQRVKGVVIVEVTVDEKGRVVDADIATSPSPLLNAEALSAAQKLRFAPYQVEGRPVSFMTRVPFRFDFR